MEEPLCIFNLIVLVIVAAFRHLGLIVFFFNDLGLELVDKLYKLTGLNIRIPTGYLGNYKFSIRLSNLLLL